MRQNASVQLTLSGLPLSRCCPASSKSRGWYSSPLTGPDSLWSQRVCCCTCRSAEKDHCVIDFIRLFSFCKNIQKLCIAFSDRTFHLSSDVSSSLCPGSSLMFLSCLEECWTFSWLPQPSWWAVTSVTLKRLPLWVQLLTVSSYRLCFFSVKSGLSCPRWWQQYWMFWHFGLSLYQDHILTLIYS